MKCPTCLQVVGVPFVLGCPMCQDENETATEIAAVVLALTVLVAITAGLS